MIVRQDESIDAIWVQDGDIVHAPGRSKLSEGRVFCPQLFDNQAAVTLALSEARAWYDAY